MTTKPSFLFTVLFQTKSANNKENSVVASFSHYFTSELHQIQKQFSTEYSETLQRSAQSLRGGLSQFLSTPIKSDAEEIGTLIRETVSTFAEQITGVSNFYSISFSSFHILESAVVPLHKQSVNSLKTLLKKGKTLLVETGCSFGKNAGELWQFQFEMQDLSNISVVTQVLDKYFSLEDNKNSVLIISSSIKAIQHKQQIESNYNGYVLQFHFDNLEMGIIEKLSTQLREISFTSILSINIDFGLKTVLECYVDIQTLPLAQVLSLIYGVDKEVEEYILQKSSLIVLHQPQ